MHVTSNKICLVRLKTLNSECFLSYCHITFCAKIITTNFNMQYR